MQRAWTSQTNTMSFALLPANTSQDCINTCMYSADCVAVTYNSAAKDNCTHFFAFQDITVIENVPSAVTVTKQCVGTALCTVFGYGEYQTGGSTSYDYKPIGTPAKTLSGSTLTASEKLCRLACSSYPGCLAVSYYDGICEIYTSANTMTSNGTVLFEKAWGRRSGFTTGCPSGGADLCGFPPTLPFLKVPTFTSVSVNTTATYVCNETYSSFVNGNGNSLCRSNLTWSDPGSCDFTGACYAGRTLVGVTQPPIGGGSLAYVFSSGTFNCTGVVSRWQIFVRNVDIPVYLDIWAPVGTQNTFKLLGSHKFIPTVTGLQYVTPTVQVAVFPGHAMGFHYESNAIPSDLLVIPHADGTSLGPWHNNDLLDINSGFLTHANLTIGKTVTFMAVSS